MSSKEYNKLFIIWIGWLSIIISIIFLPVVFGIIGIIHGVLLISKKRKKHGTVMIFSAILFATLGILFGFICS